MSISDVEIMGGVGFGYDEFSYDPLRQEPSGYSYSSENRNNLDSNYEYDDYDTRSRHASIHNGIKHENPRDNMDGIYLSNEGEVESYFQKLGISGGVTENIKKNFPTKENLTDVFSGENSKLMFLIIILFVIVAYAQHCQIQNLQDIIGYMLIKPQITMVKKE